MLSGSRPPFSWLKIFCDTKWNFQLDSWFFDLKFEITSFDYSYPTNTGAFKTQSYSGWRFNDIQSQFNGLKSGQKVIFDNFKYKIKGSKEKEDKMYESLVITIL